MHPDALKALLHKPFTGTLNHARPQGHVLLMKVWIADVGMVSLKVSLHLT
jgi:hypothetical protein